MFPLSICRVRDCEDTQNGSHWDVLPEDDFDSDGLSNLREFKLGLSLINPDADDDDPLVWGAETEPDLLQLLHRLDQLASDAGGGVSRLFPHNHNVWIFPTEN